MRNAELRGTERYVALGVTRRRPLLSLRSPAHKTVDELAWARKGVSMLKLVLILVAVFHNPCTPVRVARFCAVEAGLRISDDYDIAKPVTLACVDRYHVGTCWRQAECEAFFGEECKPLEECEQFHPDVGQPSELGCFCRRHSHDPCNHY